MVIYAAKAIDVRMAWGGRLDEVIASLDEGRRLKLSTIKHKDEYTRSVFAGLLLRYAFLNEGNSVAQWQSINIVQGEYGKPYIEGRDGFHYSISHSGEWVICAVDDMPIGADIQEQRRWRLNTAKRFYSKEEYDRLTGIGEYDTERQRKLFYKMWTAKESCVKLTGRGIGAGINRYVTDSSLRHIYGDDNIYFNINIYDTIDNYIVCVCSEREDFPYSITNIEQERLW